MSQGDLYWGFLSRPDHYLIKVTTQAADCMLQASVSLYKVCFQAKG